jgi:hypothetical protein
MTKEKFKEPDWYDQNKLRRIRFAEDETGWAVDWFPEEIITQKDFQNLPDIKVDIFITHTCPSELVPDLKLRYPDKGEEPSNHALSELWKIYKPSLWFFGHWHQYGEYKMMGTQCYALSAPGFGDRWWMWLPKRR